MGKQEIKQKIQAAMQSAPQKENVKSVRLFGSQLHGDAKQTSDIDLLVDFDESAPVGYFEIVRLQAMLEKTLGSQVDIVTPRALSKYFRDAVLKEAETVYER
jgi:predicted nucleotidyltransferase